MRTDVKNFSALLESSVADVIVLLDKNGCKIVVIVDCDGVAQGVVTDGDVRRALLKGLGTDSPARLIMNSSFISVDENCSRVACLRKLAAYTIPGLPVLNSKTQSLIGLFVTSEAKTYSQDNSVFILAGGRGERLRPLTDACPKPMLSVGGIPILEIIMRQFMESGFYDFYFSVSYLKEQIRSYFGNGSRFGVSITYVEEDQPLGTAGPLSLMDFNNIRKPLVVANGDVLTRVNFEKLIEFHSEQNADVTVCSRSYSHHIPFGVLETEDSSLIKISEKPTITSHVSAGIYVLEPKILNFVPENKFLDMPDLLNSALFHKSKISIYPLHEDWIDVGVPEALDSAQKLWNE